MEREKSSVQRSSKSQDWYQCSQHWQLWKVQKLNQKFLGLGLSVIALNLGMYIGLPAFGILKVIQLRKN